MLTLKINSNKYIELFQDTPNMDFILFNWDYEIKYIFDFPLYIIYTKRTKQ